MNFFYFKLIVNYFAAAHSATATVCATNADCHLIVTLGILAVCPFIFSSCASPLVDYVVPFAARCCLSFS